LCFSRRHGEVAKGEKVPPTRQKCLVKPNRHGGVKEREKGERGAPSSGFQKGGKFGGEEPTEEVKKR